LLHLGQVVASARPDHGSLEVVDEDPLKALIALAVVIPPAPRPSSRGTTDQRGITMLLRPRGLIPSGGHWMLPIELPEHALGQVLQPLYLRFGWELLS
jgi:hypothetical protein